jgi:hypothetical protein
VVPQDARRSGRLAAATQKPESAGLSRVAVVVTDGPCMLPWWIGLLVVSCLCVYLRAASGFFLSRISNLESYDEQTLLHFLHSCTSVCVCVCVCVCARPRFDLKVRADKMPTGSHAQLCTPLQGGVDI